MTITEKKIGLTFSQILALITVLGVFITGWISFQSDFTKFKAETAIKIEQLEKGRVENAVKIKELSQENKDDHQLILNKLDDLIYDLNKKI